MDKWVIARRYLVLQEDITAFKTDVFRLKEGLGINMTLDNFIKSRISYLESKISEWEFELRGLGQDLREK